MAKKNNRLGVMYSTDKNFEYEDDSNGEELTLEPGKQKLYVSLDKKMRKGKTVTLIEGFVGTLEDQKALAKELKQKCGTGGSCKEYDILVQGDFKNKLYDYLISLGYSCKKKG